MMGASSTDLYCEACVANTIEHTTKVNAPPRESPCQACYNRLLLFFSGTPYEVAQRMIHAGMLVLTNDGGFGFSEYGCWAWADVVLDQRTPEHILRTLAVVIAKWGSQQIVGELVQDITELSVLRSEGYSPQVRQAMEYCGPFESPQCSDTEERVHEREAVRA